MRASRPGPRRVLLAPTARRPGGPAQPLCRGGATDDTPRPIPDSLVPAAVRLFGLEAMPAGTGQALDAIPLRRGADSVCNLGANLPCGKANTRRDLPAADAWCAENPGSDFIPMYVTGHDTIYRWRCDGTKAAISGEPLAVDRRGFIARLWKPVDAAAETQR